MGAPGKGPLFAAEKNQLFAYAPNTVKQLTFGERAKFAHPDLSWDGRWLAYAATIHSDRPDIYIQALEGGPARVIAQHPLDDVTPCFSPDGKHVAFASMRTGSWDIYIATLDGNVPLRQITDDTWQDFAPNYSPDGRKLVFCSRGSPTNPWRIVMVDVETGTRTHLTDGLWPVFSPTGEEIAFVRPSGADLATASLWTVKPDGSALQQVYRSENHGVITPAWAGPDWLLFGTAGRIDGNAEVGWYHADDIWAVRRNGTGLSRVTWHGGRHWDPVYDMVKSMCYFVGSLESGQNLYSAALDLPEGSGDSPVVRGE
jgi:TolB protein